MLKIIWNFSFATSPRKSSRKISIFKIKCKKQFKIFYTQGPTDTYSFRKCKHPRRRVSAHRLFAFGRNGWNFYMRNQGQILPVFFWLHFNRGFLLFLCIFLHCIFEVPFFLPPCMNTPNQDFFLHTYSKWNTYSKKSRGNFACMFSHPIFFWSSSSVFLLSGTLNCIFFQFS